MKRFCDPLQQGGGGTAGPDRDRGLAGGVSRPAPGSTEEKNAQTVAAAENGGRPASPGAAESGGRPASPNAAESGGRPASPYAAGTGAAAGPSADPEEEKRTICDGMDIAEVRRILEENAGQTVIYLHDGGRFELTGAVLCEAPQAGMAQLPFGEYVLCADKARGIL